MKLTEEAETDLDQQKDYNRKKLAQEIKEKLGQNQGQENISYINKPEFGIEFHRLKLKEDELDHRVYFDYKDSETIVFAVRHRDYAYSSEDMKEITQRLDKL